MGDLQMVSIFRRDPLRPVADPTGNGARVLSSIPLPNNFRVGDGLNITGYTWIRPVRTDFRIAPRLQIFRPIHLG